MVFKSHLVVKFVQNILFFCDQKQCLIKNIPGRVTMTVVEADTNHNDYLHTEFVILMT